MASTKTKQSTKSTAARRKAAPKTVDEYVARVADPARGALEKLRAIIRSVVPKDATEVISYGIPAFRNKHILVWYGVFSDHCSLFPTAAVIERFKSQLKTVRISKGTIHLPLDKPLPAALIRKIVKARIRAAGT
jgi:uncharacterized protein YdhG (YjbR/CyaY superfamily)